MISNLRPLLVTLALVAFSGAGGAFVGARLLQSTTPDRHETFHERLFSEIQLSKEQQEQLNALEVLHAVEKLEHQEQLAAANRALADTMARENDYNPAVEGAVENVHAAMLKLQKATIRHLYEMREILTPDQQVIFDRHVEETIREVTH